MPFLENLQPVKVAQHYFNGLLVDELSPATSADENVTTVYEVIRVQQGKLLFWNAHKERLLASAKAENFETLADKEWESHLLDLAKQQTGSQNIRIELTQQANQQAIDVSIFFVESHYFDKIYYNIGASCGLAKYTRPDPQVKRFNKALVDEIETMREKYVFDEVLLVNEADEITEGSRSNIMLFKEDLVFFPPSQSALPGVTLSIVKELLKAHQVTYTEQPIPLNEIVLFDAVAMLGTSPRVMPIRAIDSASFDPKNARLQQIRGWYEERLLEEMQK